MGRRQEQPRRLDERKPTPAEQAIREGFGEQLRRRRESLGLTQDAMAKKCGVSKVYYGVVELGKKSASLETIAKMASGLGITPAELLRFDAPAESQDESPAGKLGRQVAAMAAGASASQCRKILKLVKVYLEDEPGEEEPAGRKGSRPR